MKKLDPENPNPGQPLRPDELKERGIDPNYEGERTSYNTDERGNRLPDNPKPKDS